MGNIFCFTAGFFILSAILKFELGFPGLYDVAEPMLIRLGLKEEIGWNINGSILFGPAPAIVLGLFTILNIKEVNQEDSFYVSITVRKSPINFVLILFAGFLLIFLLLYAIGENCRC